MIKRILLTILGLLVIFAAIAGIKALQIKAMIDQGAKFQMPPEVITSAEVQTQTWESTMSAIGTFKAVQGVMVSAELPGKIQTIDFESGDEVAKGDLLVQQDVSSEQAQLRAAQATVALTKTNLDRSQRLLAQKTVPQSDFDSADAEYKRALANEDEIETVIAKKTIEAPFAGKLGIRQVNLGENIATGQDIVSLQSLDPIYVEFSLPQQYAPSKPGANVRVAVDALPGETVAGKITAINPMANAATRSVTMQATVANPTGKLLPGMFADVTVVADQPNEVLAIPATAIVFAPYGDSVFVVEKKPGENGGEGGLVVRQQLIQIGERRGDFVSITKGLNLGEKVASSGVFKLRNDQAVVIDNTLAPEVSIDPKPEDN